jgi:hypothetical protein
MTVAQWSRKTGISRGSILRRYHLGIAPEKILSTVE